MAFLLGPNEVLFRLLNLAGVNPALDVLGVGLTTIGDVYVLALLAVPLYARGHKEAAADVLAAILVTLVATEILRYLIGLPRPCQALPDVRLVAFVGCPEDPAFPSGHASRAFGVATVLASRFPRRYGAAALAVAALIALSRVYLGVHWPLDVFAGGLLGIALGALLEAVSRRSVWYRAGRRRAIALVDRLGARVRGA